MKQLLILIVLMAAATDARGATFQTIDAVVANGIDNVARDIAGSRVVGYYSDQQNYDHGFVYDGSSYSSLDYPGALQTIARSIDGNNIVGTFTTFPFGSHGFLYNDSGFSPIDFPSAFGTSAAGIDGSTIVGTYTDTAGVSHGFRVDGTTYSTLDDPGGVNGTILNAVSGNKIVGVYYDAANQERGFVYDGTTFTDLSVPGAVNTTPLGIDGNHIVGSFMTPADNLSHKAEGFYFNGATFSTLDHPLAQLLGTMVSGIDGTSAVGSYADFDNHFHAFMALQVPEPPAWVLAILAATSVVGAAQCRRALRVLSPRYRAFIRQAD